MAYFSDHAEKEILCLGKEIDKTLFNVNSDFGISI
jgi:hypothetical protein